MIYVTGHLQDGLTTLQNLRTDDNETLGKGDKLIVCGDCKYFYMMPLFSNTNPYDNELDCLEACFDGEIFFVPGVNDKRDMLDMYPIVNAYGGRMRKIRENFFTLENGGIYHFEEKSFFVMSGGYKPAISLSPAFSRSQQRAMPTDDELFRAVQNLENREMKVDYIVTHTAPYTLALVCEEMIFPEECRLLSILDHVFDKGSYTQWFFGRYRKDKSSLHSKVTACWDNLYRVQ